MSLAEPLNNIISFMAVGDIMLGREVGQQLKDHPPDWLFSQVKDVFKKSDVLVGNLECPILNSDKDLFSKAGIPLYAISQHAIPVLKDADFTLLSLANNHILDYGEHGLLNTLITLKKHAINYVGAGEDLNRALQPKRLTVKKTRFSFLAYCPSYNATDKSGGTAPYNIQTITRDIEREKKESDVLVISLHCGVEYSDYPTETFIKETHYLVERGADIILGHHPHVLQGVERFKNGIIAYSLGNFVFDFSNAVIKKAYKNSILSTNYGLKFDPGDNRPNQSLILEILIKNKKVEDIVMHPVLLNDDFRPNILVGASKKRLLDRISSLSDNISSGDHSFKNALHQLESDMSGNYYKNITMGDCLKNIKNFRLRHVYSILKMAKHKISFR